MRHRAGVDAGAHLVEQRGEGIMEPLGEGARAAPAGVRGGTATAA